MEDTEQCFMIKKFNKNQKNIKGVVCSILSGGYALFAYFLTYINKKF